MDKDDTYGLDLTREDLDLLRRIADNGSCGFDGPTLERLQRLGYLTPPDLTGSRRLTAKGELTAVLAS